MEEDRRRVSWDDYHWLQERCEDLQEKYFKTQYQIKELADYIKNDDIAGAMEYLVSEGLC